jgi:hypothetical protein
MWIGIFVDVVVLLQAYFQSWNAHNLSVSPPFDDAIDEVSFEGASIDSHLTLNHGC